MTSPSSQDDRPIRRHDLIFVSPAGWRSLLATRADLAGRAASSRAGWTNGWPLIGRRADARRGAGRAAGSAFAALRRQKAAFVSHAARRHRLRRRRRPCSMTSAAWRPPPGGTRSARWRRWPRGMPWRRGSSAAWRGSALTGLDYLTDRSDLDLLLQLRRDTDLHALAADLAAIEAAHRCDWTAS